MEPREPDRVHGNRKAVTAGVFMDSADSYLGRRIIADVLDAAEDHGVRLVFFFGGSFDGDGVGGPLTWAYSMPSPETIDALIVLPHSVAPHNPRKTAETLLAQFPAIPCYSLLADIPERFSVFVNEDPAIDELARHLVRDHAYRTFAVITGNSGPDGLLRARQEALERALAANGARLLPENVYTVSPDSAGGRLAAGRMLRAERDAPDVIVCMNDELAIGATREFLDNGISVPEDIAIVGFDDVEENAMLPSPSTTIAYPIGQIAAELMARVVSDHDGKTAYRSERVSRDARLVKRRSCGCSHSEMDLAERGARGFLPARNAALRNVLEVSIEEAITRRDGEVFLEFINRSIRELSRSGDLVGDFIDIFSTQWTISLLRHQEREDQVFINALFVDAFRKLEHTRTRLFARLRAFDLGTLVFYKSCGELLAERIDVKTALRGIGKNLSEIGVSRCLIVFLDPADPSTGELRLSYKRDYFTEIPRESEVRFPVRDIVNNGIHSIPEPVGVLPIAHKGNLYGYLVLSFPEREFRHFSMIRDLVSRIVDAASSNDLLACQIHALSAENTVLSKLSTIDEFTGLGNRRTLYATGKARYDRATQRGEATAFVFIDMDGLKKINDSWGHSEGDAAILALSVLLKKSFRGQDLLVRYGGDEFVVLMEGLREEAVTRVLTRLQSQLDSFNASGERPWKLGASWGYVFNPAGSAGRSFESVIEESDARLYEEKRKKRANG